MKRTLLLTTILIVIAATGCRARREAAQATMTAQAQALLTAQAPAEVPVEAVSTAPPPTATPLPTIPAVVPEAGGEVLFFDDFQDGQADRWKISAAWDVQQDGDLYYFASPGQGAAWVPGGANWTDYFLRAAVRVDTGNFGLYFRVTQQARYLLALQDSGTYLVKGRTGGDYSVLSQTSPLSRGVTHWIAIAAQGGHLQVYADQVLLLDYTDSDPLRQGTIGVATAEGAQAMVDNVRVTRLGATAALPVVSTATPWSPVASGGFTPPEVATPPPEIVTPPEAGAQPPEAQVPAPSGPAQISFTVEGGSSATIDAGQCVTTEWSVENALEVYYQGLPVTGHEFRDECPAQTTTYTLQVVQSDGTTTSRTVTVTVGGGAPVANQPAMRISLALSNYTPAVNEWIAVMVSVVNAGGATAENFDVVILPHYGDGPQNPGGIQRLDALAPGESASVQFEAIYPNPGQYTLRALVTDTWYATGSAEPGSTGAAADATVTVGGEPPGGQPDLRVSAVSIDPASPAAGQPVTVRVTVSNNGDQAAGAFTVRWQPHVSWQAACNWDIGGVAAGASAQTPACTYTYASAGLYNWLAIADTDSDIAESNEGNNEQSGVLTISVEGGGGAGAPLAPINCRVIGASPTELMLRWDVQGIRDGFRIYQGRTSLVRTLPPTAGSAIVSNLAPGTQYHLDVRAYNSVGESPVDACAVDGTTTNPPP